MAKCITIRTCDVADLGAGGLGLDVPHMLQRHACLLQHDAHMHI